MEQKGYSFKKVICTHEKERLWFAKKTDGSYEIYNQAKNELIGKIRKERNGTWMHFSLVIDLDLMKGLVESGNYLSFSPGCQDEIREFCKELNGKKVDVISRTCEGKLL